MRSARTRRMLLTTALATLAIVAIALIALRIASPPVEHPDYLAQMQALADARITDGRNAWDVYKPVLDEIRSLSDGLEIDDRIVLGSLHDLTIGDWDDPKHEKNRSALDLMRPLVLRAQAAQTYESFAREYDTQEIRSAGSRQSDALLSDLPGGMVPLKRIGDANRAMLREAAIEGRWSDVVSHVSFGLTLARHGTQCVNVLELMVGLGHDMFTLLELRKLLNEFAVPPEACDALIRVLDGTDDYAENLHQALEGERLYSRMYLREIFDGEDDDASSFFQTALATWSGVVERMYMHEVDAAFARAEEHWERGYVDPQVDVLDLLGVDLSSLPVLLEATEGSMHIGRRLQIETLSLRAATICMLRLEIFHAQRNRWPDTLAEALGEPGALDPVSGLPFEYQLLADDPGERAYELRAPSDAWHIRPEVRVLNPARGALPDSPPYGDPDFED